MNRDLVVDSLSEDERLRLREHECKIEKTLAGMDEAIEALIEIRDLRLYRETHTSFEDYCLERWGKTWRRMRQLSAASATATTLQQAGTIVPLLPVNESQVRSIATLSAEEQIKVWVGAVEQAGGQQPTGAQVADEKLRHQVRQSRVSPVIQRMNEGRLTPAKALEVVTALEGCEPKVRYEMLRLQIEDRAIIQELNRLFKQGRDSYFEIVASGFLQFVDGPAIAIAKAKAVDLRRYLDERMQEHRRGAVSAGTIHVVNLYGGDPERSFKTLLKTLHTDDLQGLKRLFAEWEPGKVSHAN
jgi:hypothetical protein